MGVEDEEETEEFDPVIPDPESEILDPPLLLRLPFSVMELFADPVRAEENLDRVRGEENKPGEAEEPIVAAARGVVDNFFLGFCDDASDEVDNLAMPGCWVSLRTVISCSRLISRTRKSIVPSW
jgi:hypothetical protein